MVKYVSLSVCYKTSLPLRSIGNNQDQPGWDQSREIPTPIKFLMSSLPEMINQICKKYSLDNSQDKKTSDDTCDVFQK